MIKIFLGTNNENKVKEIKQILGENVKLILPKDLGINIDIEETGKTFEENAIIKAKEMYRLAHLPVITEDCGLCIDALNGRPGVYSKRYFEDLGKTEYEGNLMILNELKDVPKEKRTARYVACYCYYDGQKTIIAEGTCEGYITHELKGTNGFAYDPIFFSTELNKTFGEALDEEKQSVSQRKKGIEILKQKLLEQNINL